MYFKEEGFKIRIADIIDELKQTQAPTIEENATIDKVLDTIVNQETAGVLYVIDEDKRLKGTITLDEVVRHIFSLSHEHRIHSRRIMDMVTSEDVGHIMKKRPPYVLKSDDIGEIIRKMVKSNMKHLPLLDEEKRVICDISMIDIIKRMIETDKE